MEKYGVCTDKSVIFEDDCSKINTFYKRLEKIQQENSHYRYGQAVFNTAYELYPNIAQEYCGTCIDPFHNDNRVNDFINALFVPMEYDKYCELKEEDFWIENAESGADREFDFNPEDECYKRYDEYLSFFKEEKCEK